MSHDASKRSLKNKQIGVILKGKYKRSVDRLAPRTRSAAERQNPRPEAQGGFTTR